MKFIQGINIKRTQIEFPYLKKYPQKQLPNTVIIDARVNNIYHLDINF